jgi:tyrosyl-tRNA synthetase
MRGAAINEAKRVLANEVTRLAHGDEAAKDAEATALETFEAGRPGRGLPAVEVGRAALSDGMPLAELLVLAGLASSRGEARRLIRGSGARLNDEAVSDEARAATLADLRDGCLKLSAGRKRHALVRPV